MKEIDGEREEREKKHTHAQNAYMDESKQY